MTVPFICVVVSLTPQCLDLVLYRGANIQEKPLLLNALLGSIRFIFLSFRLFRSFRHSIRSFRPFRLSIRSFLPFRFSIRSFRLSFRSIRPFRSQFTFIPSGQIRRDLDEIITIATKS
jgi:hypothetical protein